MAKKHRKKKRHVRIGAVICLLVILVLLIFLIFGIHYRNALRPINKSSEEVTFTVPEGSSLKSVTKQLAQDGIIKDSDMAYLYLRNKNYSIYAGDYTLDKSWSLDEIFAKISDPSAATVNQAKVTIIEGDNVQDIARKISEVTNVTSDDLLALWNNEEWIRSQMSNYPFLTEDMFKDGVRTYLEGYLAPDTYNFMPETTAEDVTKIILNQTLVIYNANQADFARYNVHDVYTLASIVQAEASDPEDMAKIAQIFLNRMSGGYAGGTAGLLQSSVTVCYANNINLDTESWMNCESSANAQSDDPYNTYKYPGLPPGPICAPGSDAIYAVLHPDTSMEGYYFFMADVKTGRIYYSKTSEEQAENVEKIDNGYH